MYKKVTIIIFLSLSLATILFVRDYYMGTSKMPRLVDRLPEGDFLIRANVLDVARETSGMLYANKVGFRDFISYEFLLGQAKSYGLNLQRPVYVFANEAGDWGAMIYVSDSSKISPGLVRLKTFFEIKDTVFFEQQVRYNEEENMYVAYSKTWMFVYKGENFKRNLFRVVNAERDKINPAWHAFLNEKKFKNQKLVLSSNWKSMKRYGIEKAVFAHDSDSSSFTLMAYVKSVKPWTVTPKKGGKSLALKSTTDRFMNLHLDASKLRYETEDPLYKLMNRLSKKVSFPLNEFLATWEGDLSLRQGGNQKVKETFVETIFDDNFNSTEVTSVREVQVPGFSLGISFNHNYKMLMDRLLQKGILTKEGEKFRFLISPLLNYGRDGKYHIFYSGEYQPKMISDESNNGIWNERGTKFQFQLEICGEFKKKSGGKESCWCVIQIF
ncbi:MAG: hypothetical protein KJ941_10065, partial [Bacteroidetes bacterium]|nr:hypothetical protein [Bacteroidota bacterium]